MKCPTCESCEYEQYCGATEIMRKCERHNKKVEMTNEEWIKQCNTEQLVDAIYDCTMENSWSFSKDGIKRWLKQPHSPK